ncbi:MAG TPA: cytochrome C oxidase subunit IV family protein [Fimbriimonadales bacterium]|nr:cytochrome C oxidase subunit IV family protein [Fimbriimonadales bacterium]
MQMHIVPVRVYFIVYVLLMILLFVTYWVATMHLGRWNTVVAMLVAMVKTSLVALFFMHLYYSGRLTHVWAAVGFLFLVIMFGLTMNDYITREPSAPGLSVPE